ncbi:dead box ATP-dependent rna helicase [Lecanosticta acicola]|uniref:Dead box ATP-dependent rna helicase n=1 Tax=Lecanosticta acicola TaxID=111012 RepID=A0AAI8YTA4_9PEZI|nr:dead box ATP-dependent rna helicase [Lecanosticta acicola]
MAEAVELQRLQQKVTDEPEEFEHWEKLVRALETQEGGLNRNSSPQAIAVTRDTYDRFLARFPLFFGYWKKYADLEFAIAGTEAAEMVYERGVASIGISVDLWANYCSFKVETSHDPDVIRELFERAAESVGLDFLAHPFWDKYIEFEERLESPDRIFGILARIIHIPLHQYARYFESYRTMAAKRQVEELAPPEILAGFREEIESKPAADQERELRSRLDTYHMEIFNNTQSMTTDRWTYEQEVKRPYYHVTDLDEAQLTNWRKYLDFEEGQGDYTRTKFLYERCLVTCANYEEFWYRYARWTLGQTDRPEIVRNEEARNIYRRAACIYVYISHPEIRLWYARFEESLGRADIAIAIHDAILRHLPGHLDTIISLVNTHRRQDGIDTALNIIRAYINSPDFNSSVKGALVAEEARLVWKIKGDPEAARQIFANSKQQFLDCKKFWVDYLEFERNQPTSEKEENARYQRMKAVLQEIRFKTRLQPATIADLSATYMMYLEERGDKDAMIEWIELDRQINGPYSVTGKVDGEVPSSSAKPRTVPNGSS